MNLPFLKKQQEKKEYFFSLIVKPHKIGVILFEEIDKHLVILASHDESQKQRVDNLSSEELIEICDRVISSIESYVPENITVTKTIFSIPSAWVEDGKIKKEYLSRFKQVCEALELTPIGFIVSAEAIAAYLQRKQGAPLTSLFVEVTHDSVFVYLIKSGNILEIKEAVIEEGDVVATVEKVLKTITSVEVLPSQIVILDTPESEALQQKFLSHQWTQRLPFLHLPQVTVLDKGFENEALIQGVASQMGFEVLENKEEINELKKQESLPEELWEQFEAPSEELPTQDKEQIKKAQELGFFREKDIAFESSAVERKKTEEPIITHFQKGEESVTQDLEESEVDENKEQNKKIKLSKILAFPISFIGNMKASFNNLKNPFSSISGRGKLWIPLVGIAIIIIGVLYVYYAMVLKADVAIQVNEQSFQKTQNITFSPQGQDFSSNTLSLKTIDQKVTGNVSQSTSGKQDTGNKATGSVTIYNKTDNSQDFPSGTILEGPNSLEFVTTSDVTVASTSAFSTSFTSSDVNVQASNFGTDYNLPSGTNFTFKDFSSDYFAKNSNAFSGGTKTTEQVVSKSDLSNLESSAVSQLKGQAISQATSQVGSGEVLLSTPLATDFSDETFSKKAGQQASSVQLSTTVDFTLGIYNMSELNNYAKTLADGQIPNSYTLSSSNSHIDVTNIKMNNDKTVSATLNISNVYQPNMNISNIASQIVAKSVGSAQSSIKNMQGVSDVTITFQHKIPFLPDWMPLKSKNITVEMKS